MKADGPCVSSICSPLLPALSAVAIVRLDRAAVSV